MWDYFFGISAPFWRGFLAIVAIVMVLAAALLGVFGLIAWPIGNHRCAVYGDNSGLHTKYAGGIFFGECYIELKDGTWVTFDQYRGFTDGE